MLSIESAVDRVRAGWLTRVRWGAVLGQLLAILVSGFYLDFGLRVLLLLSLSVLTTATNVWLVRRVRRDQPLPSRIAGGILVFDTVVLTALLSVTGGPSNPFSVLYLVQITVAAVMLRSRWVWAIAGCSSLGYALLFALPHEPMPGMASHVHGQWTFSLHLEGMWLALVTAAALTAYFVTRLSSALEQRERELAAMRDATAQQQRMAAVTTLAAGAAHELATPMATIAVVARELERAIDGQTPSGDLREDVRLVRAEVERCGDILRRMAPGSGAEEPKVMISVGTLVGDVIGGLSRREAACVKVEGTPPDAVVAAPRAALGAAVISLVRNALDASASNVPVALAVRVEPSSVSITVRDRGVGMARDVLLRAGEPFFTTKPPGKGMGLGLFLARSLAERLGGTLLLDSIPGGGTVATLSLPLLVQEGERCDDALA